MIILWIRKNKTGERNCSSNNGQNSFQKHDKEMKGFRLSHPEMETMNPRDIMTTDGNILAAVNGVKLNQYAQN